MRRAPSQLAGTFNLRVSETNPIQDQGAHIIKKRFARRQS
jgi:hypothetical protein